jgi:long-chain acyl-CoA synthetase
MAEEKKMEKVEVRYQNIREMIERRAVESEKKPYIFFYGREITFGEFNRLVNRFANGLLKLGIKKGDVVYIYMTNSPEHLIATCAAVKIGAIACPINTLLKPFELEYELNDSMGKVIVLESQFIPVISGIKNELKYLKYIIELGETPSEGSISYSKIISEEKNELQEIPIEKNDHAFIFYTSGTTGKPKGAILTHWSTCYTLAGIRMALGPERGDEAEEDECALIFLPLFHVNAMMSMLSGIYRGFKIALLRKFSVREFGPTVERYKCTFFSAVPKVYKILLEAKDTVKKHDLSSLKFGVCGAAPMPAERIVEFEKEFGIEILEGYGLTEGTVASTLHRRGGKKKIGSIGPALPGQEVRIMDENGNFLGPNQVGEIVIRGDNVMVGYFGKEEETKKTLKDGWLHTGDIGYVDEEGFFYIVDRSKDMIIKGGENIYPKEVEDVLHQHPKVHDAAVIGVKHEIHGEEVKAFIVPKIGEKITEEEIIEFASKHLADYKVPRIVEFVIGLPTNPVGKVMKKELREGRGIITFSDLENVPEINLDFIFQAFPSRFNKEKAGRWNACLQYIIHGKNSGEWCIEIKDGEMNVKKGRCESPTCIIKTYDLVLMKLVTKELDGVTAINSGLIQIEGNESDLAILSEVMG